MSYQFVYWCLGSEIGIAYDITSDGFIRLIDFEMYTDVYCRKAEVSLHELLTMLIVQ